MKILLKLIKVNLLTFFDIHKLFNTKKKDLIKVIPMLLIYIYAFGTLSYSIYSGSKFILKGLDLIQSPHLLLVLLMGFSSFYLMITTTFQVNKTLYNAKDYNLLLSLPIKKSTIIVSKLFILYIINLIFLIFFMLPAYVAYILFVNLNIVFHLVFWISFFFIPLLPTVIGGLIGNILTSFSSLFKHKNFMNIVVSLLFILGVFYATNSLQSMTTVDIANISGGIVDKVNNVYPLSKIYLDIIKNNSISSLFIFITLSCIVFAMFKSIISKYFNKINSRLASVTINNKYDDSKVSINKPIMSLYKKELKRYFSSSVYVLNTGIGCLLLVISLFALAFFGSDKLDIILNIPNVSDHFITNGPLMFGVFCCLSCTTHSSISLEGKNLWNLKSIPLNTTSIFISKILVNLTILLPTIVFSSILLIYILKLPLISIISLIIIPGIYAIFISGLGLLINLYYPVTDWVNEVKVIKQSMASLITIILGMSFGVIPLVLSKEFNISYYSWIVAGVIFIFTLVIYRVLFTRGKELFKKI